MSGGAEKVGIGYLPLTTNGLRLADNSTKTAKTEDDKDSQQVRTVEIDGDIWFVAKDVCDVLEIGNPTEALKPLDDDEKGSLRISEGTSKLGGNPNMNVISEAGLYTLLLRSNKEQAKPFRRWVTHEVVPSIRKHGAYMTPQNWAKNGQHSPLTAHQRQHTGVRTSAPAPNNDPRF